MQVLEDTIQEKLICAHCGDHCENTKVSSDDNVFCCLGCKTVFEILHENGMDAYYRIEKQPGVSLKHNKGRDYFNFLENDDIRRRILSFESDQISKVRLFIPTIHCSSCIWLLENLYVLHKGVLKSEVNFPRKEIFIDFDPSVISLRELIELMASLGYEPEINLESTKKNPRGNSKLNRSLIVKIGIAGFCFGNIMLLSFPEYLGLENLLDSDFARFFSYINIILSLPVVLYSASGYYDAAYKGLKQKVISIDVPIAIGILTLFLRSLYEVISHTGPGYFDSLAGLVFFLLIGKWFQNRTYENLLFDRNYKSYFPIAVTRIIGGNQESVLIEELEEGDEILIRNGELIPADAELVSNDALIDNSFVTGESRAIPKRKGDYIFAGGRQIGSAIHLRVMKEVSQSYLTQLWNNEAFGKTTTKRRKILVDRISKYFTWAILGIAILAALFWIFYEPDRAVSVFTAVLIVACPCALALSTPFAVGTAMRIMGRNGCYLKNGDVVEELDKINHVVFDKTGTITYHGENGISFKGELEDSTASIAGAVAANSYHPLSRRITEYIYNRKIDINNLSVMQFREHAGKGLEASVNGKKVKLGSPEFVANGLHSVASVSASNVFLSVEDKLVGYFELKNYYREGMQEVVEGIGSKRKLSILSGDNSSELEYLESIFPEDSEIRFDQSAYDKLDFVKDLQSKNGAVMMVGDGLNDAGALAQANVGIAVTEDVNNFTPASDVILSGKNFKKLPEITGFASSTVQVIIVSFVISFLYNIVGISFAVSGNLTPVFAAILMPLSSISVVVFTTLSVKWAAFRFGFK